MSIIFPAKVKQLQSRLLHVWVHDPETRDYKSKFHIPSEEESKTKVLNIEIDSKNYPPINIAKVPVIEAYKRVCLGKENLYALLFEFDNPISQYLEHAQIFVVCNPIPDPTKPVFDYIETVEDLLADGLSAHALCLKLAQLKNRAFQLDITQEFKDLFPSNLSLTRWGITK